MQERHFGGAEMAPDNRTRPLDGGPAARRWVAPTSKGEGGPGGKSELRRTGWFLTGTGSARKRRARDSATENTPPWGGGQSGSRRASPSTRPRPCRGLAQGKGEMAG